MIMCINSINFYIFRIELQLIPPIILHIVYKKEELNENFLLFNST